MSERSAYLSMLRYAAPTFKSWVWKLIGVVRVSVGADTVVYGGFPDGFICFYDWGLCEKVGKVTGGVI